MRSEIVRWCIGRRGVRLSVVAGLALATTVNAQQVVDNGQEEVVDGTPFDAPSGLTVGGTGGGTFRVINGGTADVTGDATLDSDGVIEVDGAGSRLTADRIAQGVTSFFANNGSLTVRNGGLLEAASAAVSQWLLTGAGSAANFTGDVAVNSGVGSFNSSNFSVLEGATLTGNALRVGAPQESGVLSISGAGSSAVFQGVVRLGSDLEEVGSGRVSVANGGLFRGGNTVARRGELFASGAGSAIEIGSLAHTGGLVSVTGGASVTIDGDYTITDTFGNFSFNFESPAVVDGPGSRLTITGDVEHDGQFNGVGLSILARDGGVVDIEGSVRLGGFASDRTPTVFDVRGGRVNIAGDADLSFFGPGFQGGSVDLPQFRLRASDEFSQAGRALIDVGGALQLGDDDTILLRFDDVGALRGGQVFDLFDWGSLSVSNLGFVLLTDLGDLTLDTSMFEIDGTVRIVPTPGGVAALAFAGLVAVRRRR